MLGVGTGKNPEQRPQDFQVCPAHGIWSLSNKEPNLDGSRAEEREAKGQRSFYRSYFFAKAILVILTIRLDRFTSLPNILS